LNTAETDTINSLPGIQRVGGYKNTSDQVIKIPKSKLRFLYITPNEYSKRMKDVINNKNPHVFKIPSQQILEDHNLHGL